MKELIITWQGLLFEAIAFLVFTYLLNLFLFKPIKNLLKERMDIIGGYNENGRKLEILRDEIAKEALQEKANLKSEINKIKEGRREESASEAAAIIAAAKIEASKMYGEIIKSFDEEKKYVTDYYSSRTAEIAALIRKKMLD